VTHKTGGGLDHEAAALDQVILSEVREAKNLGLCEQREILHSEDSVQNDLILFCDTR
jgi:hypothetical protein